MRNGREQHARDDERRAHEPASPRPKAVFALTERGDKTHWTRIGVAFVNRDGSLTAKLDALPVSGTLQIREEEPRDNGNAPRQRGSEDDVPF